MAGHDPSQPEDNYAAGFNEHVSMEESDSIMAGISGDSVDLEPVARLRSNTWHGMLGRHVPSTDAEAQFNKAETESSAADGPHGTSKEGLGGLKKTVSGRRNAWGSFSYADLITQAVESSPEGRLTLAQIYDWMTKNVTYFCDRADASSSAGWKNSIRHNLSLHNRFKRLQNESGGKSSYWVINYDAMPQGRTPRRRATTMDTKLYERKRSSARASRVASMNSPSTADIDSGGSSGSFRALLSAAGGSNASSLQQLSPIEPINERDELMSGCDVSITSVLFELEDDTLGSRDIAAGGSAWDNFEKNSSNFPISIGLGKQLKAGANISGSMGFEQRSPVLSASVPSSDAEKFVADCSLDTFQGLSTVTGRKRSESVGWPEQLGQSSQQSVNTRPVQSSGAQQSFKDHRSGQALPAASTSGVDRTAAASLLEVLRSRCSQDDGSGSSTGAVSVPVMNSRPLQELIIQQQQKQFSPQQPQTKAMSNNDYLRMLTLPEFWSYGNPKMLAKVRELLLAKREEIIAAQRRKAEMNVVSEDLQRSLSLNASAERLKSLLSNETASDGVVMQQQQQSVKTDPSSSVGSDPLNLIDTDDVRFEDVDSFIRQELGDELDFNFDSPAGMLLCDDDEGN